VAESTVWTVGHSTHPLAVFLSMLQANGIERLVDVRTIPGSRRYPHFGEEPLARSLQEVGIRYERIAELGGRRRRDPAADDRNAAWRNQSFRNYADYAQTEPFARGLEHLLATAAQQRTAIMCAEAVPWRCHRSLIADALIARGVPVLDIMSPTSSVPRKPTSFARFDGERVTYPEVAPAEASQSAPVRDS